MNPHEKARSFQSDQHTENRTYERQTELDEVAKTASKDAVETVESLKTSGWVPNWQSSRD